MKDPADAEDESSPADTEEDSAVNGDNAAEEAPADPEEAAATERGRLILHHRRMLLNPLLLLRR